VTRSGQREATARRPGLPQSRTPRRARSAL